MTAISAIDSVVSNVRRSIQKGDKFPIGTHRVHNWQQQMKEIKNENEKFYMTLRQQFFNFFILLFECTTGESCCILTVMKAFLLTLLVPICLSGKPEPDMFSVSVRVALSGLWRRSRSPI